MSDPTYGEGILLGGLIDAHHHFWDPALAEYPWMTEGVSQLRRRYGPEDLEPELRLAGIEGTILVQTRSSRRETAEFLATASATGFIAGVVGWLDLADPAIGGQIEDLRSRQGGSYLVGIRHQLEDEPDPDWICRPAVMRGLESVSQAGLAYDLLVTPRELPAAIRAARELPDVRFVVDHIAKPPIAERRFEPWASDLAELADLGNVWCKLSGLVTEARWDRWQPADLSPYVAHVVAIFGPERLMFGSDWPVCTLAASYQQVIEALGIAVDPMDDTARQRIFRESAIECYGLDRAAPGLIETG